MEWQHISSFTLSDEWQYTDFIKGNIYRITHSVNNPYAYKLNAIVALINFSENTSPSEIFKPQRITPYLESEIIQFPEPPQEWQYRLAIKQLVNPRDILVNWSVTIDQPLYSPREANQIVNSKLEPRLNTSKKLLFLTIL